MATFTDQTKNSTAVTNQAPSPASAGIWDDHPETWDDAEGTFENPKTAYTKQSKNSTSLTNESKN